MNLIDIELAFPHCSAYIELSSKSMKNAINKLKPSQASAHGVSEYAMVRMRTREISSFLHFSVTDPPIPSTFTLLNKSLKHARALVDNTTALSDDLKYHSTHGRSLALE